jgi:dTMP kinase
MIIVFEGIDGAGKSTHLALLSDWLLTIGQNAKCYKEPGSTQLGKTIRDIVVNQPLDPIVALFLLSAARRQLCLEISEHEDKVILLDRFYDSTYAYQGCYLGENVIDYIVALSCNINGKMVKPDYVFLFLHSYGKKENYMDEFAQKHQQEIIDRYYKTAQMQENYFNVPKMSIKEQHDWIKQKLQHRFN